MNQHEVIRIRARNADQLLGFCQSKGFRVLDFKKLSGLLWRVKFMRAN